MFVLGSVKINEIRIWSYFMKSFNPILAGEVTLIIFGHMDALYIIDLIL